MLRLTAVVDAREVRCAPRELVLSFAERSRSRLRSVLDDGTDVGVLLPRGTVLRGGDLLRAETGEVVRVRAAIEPLYRVTARGDDTDPRFSLLRGAYHLGNRHVPLMLAPQFLHLEQDPVLREMLQRLGLVVEPRMAAFEPEAGAYGGGHRHDADSAGGSVGEQLSREAHAGRVDLSALSFHR